MSIMKDSILVKLCRYEGSGCVSIHTMSRRRKSPHWFFVTIDALKRVRDEGHIITTDICSYATLNYVPTTDELKIRFAWLESSETLTGWQQDVSLSYGRLLDRIDRNEPFTYSELSYDKRKLPRLDFTAATATLQRVLSVPTYKRRLSQALSHSFKWPGATTIRFYNDWLPYSFCFSEVYADGRDGISGGFVLHDEARDPRKVKYEMHTLHERKV